MNTKRRKVWKTVLLSTAIFIAMITAAGIYLSSHWKDIIRTQLEARAQQLSKGFYKTEIGDIRIELLKRQVKIEGISFYPDSTVYGRLKTIDSLPPVVFDIRIGTTKMQGISTAKAGEKRTLNMKKFRIDKPHIQITQTGNRVAKTGNDSVPKDLYHFISPVLEAFEIREIRIDNGSFYYAKWNATDTVRFRINDFSLYTQHLLIDSTAHNRRNRLYCDDVRLTVDTFSYMLPNGLFAVSFDRMEAAMADSTLIFDGLRFVPQYGKQLFAIKNPKHTNWMELDIKNISCMKVDYPRLLSEKSINIDSISIEGAKYTNMKNRVIEQIPTVKPMFYEYVQKIPLPLTIRTAHAWDAAVIYEDLPKGKTKPGTIAFTNMKGDAYGITNIITRKDQYMVMKAEAYVQGEGILHAVFRLPVDPHNDHFEITGNMGEMHLNRINTMLESFHVNVRTGMVDRIDFIINGNNKRAQLDMLFLYNDLRIALLKQEDSYPGTKKLISGIVNGVLLFNDNPSPGSEPRRVQTVTYRDIHRASFHYFGHILLDGFEESIGVTKKKQAQLKWLKQQAGRLHLVKEE